MSSAHGAHDGDLGGRATSHGDGVGAAEGPVGLVVECELWAASTWGGGGGSGAVAEGSVGA